MVVWIDFRSQQKTHIQKSFIRPLDDDIRIAAEEVETNIGIFFLYCTDNLHDRKSGAVLAAADIDIAGDALFTAVLQEGRKDGSICH